MIEYNFDFVKRNKIFIGIFFAILFCLVSSYMIILNWKIECQNLDDLIIIPKGASASSVAVLLEKEECFEDVGIFKLALIITMNTRQIRPGRYDFKGISTMGHLVENITSQPGDLKRVTLVEGWGVEQFADELHDKLKIDVSKFKSLTRDMDFISSLGINSVSLEGFLFPETYFFLKYHTEKEILKILVNQFSYNYKELVKKNSINSQLKMEEIVILASIIQGEAMYVDEMPMIASVYHNRLTKGMLLQADPTIQYVVPGKPRRLFNKDLEIDSPYNTYKYGGLPIGPINNPGIEALKAAMMPDDSDYLYFVSNGEGRHVFSRTVKEHNKAKMELKRKRRNSKK